MTQLPTNPDVIVIGAGTAGLSAAKSLRGAGVETLVLEAAGHTGGRCVTDHATFSVPFDRGGSWLHSAEINPLARLAEQTGMRLHKKAWEWTHGHVRGHVLCATEAAELNAYEEEMWAAIDARGAMPPDTSVDKCLPSGAWQNTGSKVVAPMLAADPDQVSVRDFHNYADTPGDWLVEGGLGAFIQTLHADVPVALNCRVTQIDTTRDGVVVTSSQGVMRAAQVILTVSTGVLAAGGIAFAPSLPPEKRDAIDQLPMGLLNKIGIEFRPTWRGATEGDLAGYHADDDTFCSVLFGFFGSPLAVGFVGGRCADGLEREGPGAATAFCIEGLRATFGTDITKHIRRSDETAWRSDETAFGSYSYAKPGGADARGVLAAPIADKLFFAGEATIEDAYSTVHGAHQSGKRAAQEVLDTRADR